MQHLASELHTALAPVLQNQPANPLLHLCSWFRERASTAASPAAADVSSAYRILRLCPANSQHCEGNIAAAFSALGAGNDGQVTAQHFGQLLELLVVALAPAEELQQQMQHVTGQLARLPPDFATFRAACKACMLLEQLCARDASSRTPADQMFQAAEARKLLAHLLTEQHWFEALHPEAPAAVTATSAAAVAAQRQQEQEAIAREAGRLVELAVAASSDDDTGS